MSINGYTTVNEKRGLSTGPLFLEQPHTKRPLAGEEKGSTTQVRSLSSWHSPLLLPFPGGPNPNRRLSLSPQGVALNSHPSWRPSSLHQNLLD